MVDLRLLREDPARFREGARLKHISVDFDRLLALDERRRTCLQEQQELRSKQRGLEKELGARMGRLSAELRSASGARRDELQKELDALRAQPVQLKEAIQRLDAEIASIEPELSEILLQVPAPPDPDVPPGAGSEDNVEIRRWNPPGFNPALPFEAQRGFPARSHIEIVERLGLADFERGVRLAGSRSYVLRGDGARLHHAVLRYALDFIGARGFTPLTVPVLVREEAMVGTGFFPAGREQAYHVAEKERGGGYDLFLAGTGEVALMGLHAGEIIDEADLPLCYATVSTCFRREAGAAGKDTAGLYRIHQFDKVEQVVICRPDEAESRRWHADMIRFVEDLLQSLELPYRLLQCCTADLGPKNADMVDIECWMPGRGQEGRGAYGETHSASRLYDYQCRRLNLRCRPGGEAGRGETRFCHSLNNTVAASPRLLIPILEVHQNAEGSVTIPPPLRPYMSGQTEIG
jgi:seryl-tRNA synthetase